jgi:serine/threonine protein kinase
MFDIIEKEDTGNTDEWINWLEEAIAKKHLKYYEYKYFSNIQEIGSGGFGKVYRANWKKFENYLVLKSFFNLNNVTVKEIVREVIYSNDDDNYNIYNILINNLYFIDIIYFL